MAKTKKDVEVVADTRSQLVALLKAKIPSTLEREPHAAYTPQLENLVDTIISLFE